MMVFSLEKVIQKFPFDINLIFHCTKHHHQLLYNGKWTTAKKSLLNAECLLYVDFGVGQNVCHLEMTLEFACLITIDYNFSSRRFFCLENVEFFSCWYFFLFTTSSLSLFRRRNLARKKMGKRNLLVVNVGGQYECGTRACISCPRVSSRAETLMPGSVHPISVIVHLAFNDTHTVRCRSLQLVDRYPLKESDSIFSREHQPNLT